ncbi:predicted protein [Sclerotinia sclerotiorum 1980 UF-70]|uniref:Uncharacterized protein n=1 Tax=Sclerotinia sclerotiorum (strain ATCC 18683 / 1980 / Ss-1) TaxID=665079 RepID=A7E6M9_SCLS1|nr:predicted protein [Sclerotinia sclerotiorum 1980 UF-70]EDN91551.1 predicted protein [Sclerotinia sclerotiorum 1980 UF-70]
MSLPTTVIHLDVWSVISKPEAIGIPIVGLYSSLFAVAITALFSYTTSQFIIISTTKSVLALLLPFALTGVDEIFKSHEVFLGRLSSKRCNSVVPSVVPESTRGGQLNHFTHQSRCIA